MLFKCHDFNGLNYSDLTNERPILLIPATGAPASGLTVILQPSPGRKPRRKTTDLLYTPWLPLPSHRPPESARTTSIVSEGKATLSRSSPMTSLSLSAPYESVCLTVSRRS